MSSAPPRSSQRTRTGLRSRSALSASPPRTAHSRAACRFSDSRLSRCHWQPRLSHQCRKNSPWASWRVARRSGVRRSATKLRIISRSRKRSVPSGVSSVTTSESAISSSRSSRASGSSQTVVAASALQPPRKTESAARKCWRRGASSRQLHSTVAWSERWRSSLWERGPERASAVKWVVSCSRSSASENARMREAASSMASGTPSKSFPSTIKSSWLRSVRAKSGRTARVRSRKSASAGLSCSAPVASGNGVRFSSCSPATPSVRRDVTSRLRSGRRASSSATLRAAPLSRSCSKLSKISSVFCSASASVSLIPLCKPSAARTRSCSPSGSTHSAKDTKAQRSNSGASRRATSTENRVLPIPPGPVRVTRRFVFKSSVSVAFSASRPKNAVR